MSEQLFSHASLSRRRFLHGSSAAALGVSLGGLEAPYNAAWADELRAQKKQLLLLWLAGGSSQLETWDPKPGRPTGGPFKAISTAVPGVQICELMPKMAAIMNRTAIVRSLDTKIADHGGAADLMDCGRPREPRLVFPDFGTVVSKELAQRDSAVPDYVSLYLATEGQRRPNPGFLGGSYAAMHLNRSLRRRTSTCRKAFPTLRTPSESTCEPTSAIGSTACTTPPRSAATTAPTLACAG